MIDAFRSQVLAIVLLAVLVTPALASDTDVFLDAVASGATGTDAATLTVSLDVANNANRFLVVGVVVGDTVATTTVGSVTYAGRQLMFLGRQTDAQGTQRQVEIWGLVAPPSGTSNVVITLQGAAPIAASIGLVAASYFNVSQVSPTGAFAGATGNSAAPSVTVAPPETEREGIFDIVECNSVRNITGSGTEQRPLIAAPLTASAAGSMDFSSSDAPSANTSTMSWTLSAGTRWTLGAVAIKPFTATENASQAGVLLDTSASGATPANANSLSVPLTVAANTSRYLVVGVAVGDANTGTTVTGVTYGGTSLTFLGRQGTGTTRKVEIWGLLAPPAGTANVVATITAGRTGSIGLVAGSYWNVDQTTPSNTFAGNTATSTAPAVTVAAASSPREASFDIVACVNTASIIMSDALQTPLTVLPLNAAADNTLNFAASSKPHQGNTMGWTLGASVVWQMAAVSLNPVPINPTLDRIAVSFDASASGFTSVAANSLTVPLTIANNPDRFLVVGVAVGDTSVGGANTVVSAVTYGTLSLSFLGQQVDSQSRRLVELWGGISPLAGTDNVVATLSGGPGNTGSIGVVAASFYNVNQDAPTGAFAGARATSNNPNVTLTDPTTTGQVIFDMVECISTSSITAAGPDQLALAPVNPPLTADNVNAVDFSSSRQSHDADNTMSWTQSSSVRWAIGAISLRPRKAPPTAAHYKRTRAARRGEHVRVSWTTSYEKDNLGFRLFREDAAGRRLITPDLIAGSALFVSSRRLLRGRSYHHDDAGPVDLLARYYLEDVDVRGKKTWYGPILVEQGPELPASSVDADPSPALRTLGRRPRKVRGARGAVQQLPAPSAGAPMQVAPYLIAPAPPSATELRTQRDLAGRAGIKLAVSATGWYRVTGEQLFVAGLPRDVDPRALELHADGREAALLVRSAERHRLDNGDAIEFFGTGQDTLQTDSRIYWLTWNTGRIRRVPALAAAGNGESAVSSFPYAVERKDRGLYVASVHNGERDNFYGAIVMGTPVEQVLAVPHPDTTGTATLSVALQGFSNNHAVAAALNGHPLGVVQWSGMERGTGSYPVPAEWLVDGDNTVRLTGSSDDDVSAVESLRIDYPHTYTADDDALSCSAPAGAAQIIRGFTNNRVRLVDVTDPDRAQELIGNVQSAEDGFAVSFTPPGAGSRTILAFTDDRAAAPASIVANRPSSWSNRSNAGAVVLITHRNFAAPLEPLRARRATQHGSAVIVDVEDIYDEFNFGSKSSAAIRDFLSTAAGWTVPPRYVLLVGDATFDPRNYAQDGLDGPIDFDFVPTKLVDTTELETASDDWFTDTTGDGAADVPIGRLPVRTAEEAAAIVAKLLAFDEAPPAAGPGRAVFVSDYRDGSTDFEASARLAATALPTSFQVDVLAADTLGAGGVRGQLLPALSSGASLIAFFGHASQEQWSESGILFGTDADGLTGPAGPRLLLPMTCLNGLYDDLWIDCMAKKFLRAPYGPAAVWASTGFCEPGAQSPLATVFLGLLTGSNPATFGDAAVAAKRSVAERDLRVTWTLFGDPSMRLR